MPRSTLDRKRKSTTGLLAIVIVGLLFYFLCSIPDYDETVVPSGRLLSTGDRIRDTSSSASLVRLCEGQAPARDMVQQEGQLHVPIDSNDLVDPRGWKDFSKRLTKASEHRRRQSGSNGALGSRSNTEESGLRAGVFPENSRSSKLEFRTVVPLTGLRIESRSDAVKEMRNVIPFESVAIEVRGSNIPKFNSGTEPGLDERRPWSRTDLVPTSSTKSRFRFLIDVSSFCDRHTLALIVVCSAWENGPRRDAIRATWASLVDHQLRVLFIVGLPKQGNRTEDHQRALERESSERGDLLQADFIDSYANLSLKSIAMLQWTESNCRSARFLVKADDDVLVNTPLLLRDLALTRHRRFVMGNVIAGARPSRDRSSKWFTSPAAYPRAFYPKYISGAAYVISGDLVHDLHAAALRAEVFWIEDVFITGLLLASDSGSDVINAQHIYNGKFDIQKEFSDPCALKRHILRHLADPADMTLLWPVITSSSVCVTSR